MTVQKISSRAIAATAALAIGAGALAVPTFASAQTYSYGNGYGNSYGNNGYYDPCARDQRSRSTTGALVGGAIGAAAGSSIASRGARTEGGVLGAVLGAVVGSSVGRSQSACTTDYRDQYSAPARSYYSYNDYSGGYRNYYDNGYGYDRDRNYDGYRSSYVDYDYGRGRPGECRWANGTVRLPNGRVQDRQVRICADERGQFRAVD